MTHICVKDLAVVCSSNHYTEQWHLIVIGQLGTKNSKMGRSVKQLSSNEYNWSYRLSSTSHSLQTLMRQLNSWQNSSINTYDHNWLYGPVKRWQIPFWHQNQQYRFVYIGNVLLFVKVKRVVFMPRSSPISHPRLRLWIHGHLHSSRHI